MNPPGFGLEFLVWTLGGEGTRTIDEPIRDGRLRINGKRGGRVFGGHGLNFGGHSYRLELRAIV